MLRSARPLYQMTDTEAAYVAGIIDGEGNIGVFPVRPPKNYRPPMRYKGRRPRQTRFYMKVAVANTSQELILWLQSLFGGAITTRPPTERTQKQWRWTQMQVRAADVLRQVRPYMIARAKQAELALDFSDAFC